MSCNTPPPNKPFKGCTDEPKVVIYLGGRSMGKTEQLRKAQKKHGAIAYVETEPHPIDRTVELLKQLSENGNKAKKKTGHPFEKYMKQKRTK